MPRDLAIGPLKGVPKYHSKQSDLGDHMMQVPWRIVLLGPGSSGKSLAMQNILVNHYRGVFRQIYLWSPTSRLDGSWAPVFEYMRRVLGQDTESIDPKEQCVFDTFNPEDLSRIVARQTEIVKKRKEIKSGRSIEMPNICLVVDDFADDPNLNQPMATLQQLPRFRTKY